MAWAPEATAVAISASCGFITAVLQYGTLYGGKAPRSGAIFCDRQFDLGGQNDQDIMGQLIGNVMS